MADFGGEADVEAFREEARAWLKANFPPALAGKGALMLSEAAAGAGAEDFWAWRKAVGEKGWATPTWPVEYGGGGLTTAQARVLRQEMAAIGAFDPMGVDMGVSMLGPTILDYGTEAQKRQHLPKIARGETRWCVGYSEPGAGSDLASLQTRGEDKGDHWLINGSKIWTSGAHWSDWCGALVRTDPTARKHDGISFILIDMHQPGVEARPIPLIAGDSPFCETFFTDAVAEHDAVLGPVNGGWTVGKRLLQHERASQTGAPAMGARRRSPLPELAKRYVGVDAQGRIADPDLRARIARQEMNSRAHALTLARAAAEAKDAASAAASILKNSATTNGQGRSELAIEILGLQGLGWTGEGFTPEELDVVRDWLGGKAMSIYGGSFEVQNNIIAKRILGLPDPPHSA